MKVTNIKWDTYGYFGPDVSLPEEVDVPDDLDIELVADYLSDNYDFCVESFECEE